MNDEPYVGDFRVGYCLSDNNLTQILQGLLFGVAKIQTGWSKHFYAAPGMESGVANPGFPGWDEVTPNEISHLGQTVRDLAASSSQVAGGSGLITARGTMVDDARAAARDLLVGGRIKYSHSAAYSVPVPLVASPGPIADAVVKALKLT